MEPTDAPTSGATALAAAPQNVLVRERSQPLLLIDLPPARRGLVPPAPVHTYYLHACTAVAISTRRRMSLRSDRFILP